jgi:hypothetical protein
MSISDAAVVTLGIAANAYAMTSTVRGFGARPYPARNLRPELRVRAGTYEESDVLEGHADVSFVVKQRLVGATRRFEEGQHRLGWNDPAARIDHTQQRRGDLRRHRDATADGARSVCPPACIDI